MDSGELSEFGDDIGFSDSEAARFQDEVVWPAINQKWGRDFLQTAVPGASLNQRVPLYDGDYGQWVEIGLSCSYDSEDDEGYCLEAYLTISKDCDELTEEAKQAYLAQRLESMNTVNKRRRRKAKRKVLAELDSHMATAQEITEYSFCDAVAGSFQVRRSIQLADEEGVVIWNSSKSRWADDQPDGIDEAGEI